jgi:hypothetical protein
MRVNPKNYGDDVVGKIKRPLNYRRLFALILAAAGVYYFFFKIVF